MSIKNNYLYKQKNNLQKDILLITPPFTQLNTPYPATAYLKGFLNTKNINSFQADLGIDVILNIFSTKGLKDLFNQVNQNQLKSKNSKRIYALKWSYIKTIDEVILFLQGNNPTLAHSICSEDFLPQASRFNHIENIDILFGNISLQDKAKYLATLYIEDISDFIVEEIDSNFGFSRYAERISSSAHTFDQLYELLHLPNSFISKYTINQLDIYLKKVNPKLLIISIPFPGNLVQAFKCGQFVKKNYPHIKIVFGGGFPNTELRNLKDKRVFEFTDFICLDDGEAPLEQIYLHLTKQTNIHTLKRTFVLENNQVKYIDNPVVKDYHQRDVGVPDYSNLRLKEYISVIEVANPMHALWSDGRWNKMTLAHGCYWAKCTFCDVSLDYIKRYQQVSVTTLCDRIENIIKQTGQTGFHFVDEAAPPALMRDLALEIIKRNLTISWWTNIRFEKRFTNDLCFLLKKSGCIAVSGGIEVASDRLLKLIDKGVDLEQLTRVTHHFTSNGIMVHSYLMYGFPTQTDQETINSLEVVRQMFQHQLINSGFWHQFAMTAHSPIGLNPSKYNAISILKEEGTFANNDRPHIDTQGCDHQKYSQGLKTSIYNFMNGAGLDLPLQEWFDFPIKPSTLSVNFIGDFLNKQSLETINNYTKLIFLYPVPMIDTYMVTKKGKNKQMAKIELHTNNHIEILRGNFDEIEVIKQVLEFVNIKNNKIKTFKQVDEFYKNLTQQHFDDFIDTTYFQQLKSNGLLLL